MDKYIEIERESLKLLLIVIILNDDLPVPTINKNTKTPLNILAIIHELSFCTVELFYIGAGIIVLNKGIPLYKYINVTTRGRSLTCFVSKAIVN